MTEVRIQDFRAAGICRDARHWFTKHGLDWKDFVKNGIDGDQLIQCEPDNPIVQRAVQAAHDRKLRDGRQ